MRKKGKKSIQKIPKLEALKQINFNAAGIDIDSEEIWICVPEDRDQRPVRCFKTFTRDLNDVSKWLKKCGIDTIAMESTSFYWISLYEILEKEGFDLYLVNARHLKNVPGRKSDVNDCQWIQQLHTYGLLRPSFIPEKMIRTLRTYKRHRERLMKGRSTQVQHMQSALHEMNMKLDRVISDITGETGMKIIRSILAGERDPKVLANYRNYRCKSSQETIEKSLEGNYQEEHLFELKQAISLFDYYTKLIIECDLCMEKAYEQLPSKVDINQVPLPKVKHSSKGRSKNTPKFDIRNHLYRICGVDLTSVDGLDVNSVQNVINEIGVNMSHWPTDKHLASWLTLCPHNDISGGKILRSKTKKSKNRAALALRQAASGLHHSDSALGAYYRRMRTRLGAPKAITATAHKLARIIYHMLKFQVEYKDMGADYYEQKYKERQIKYLKRKAEKLGYCLSPAKAA
jgi:transposase